MESRNRLAGEKSPYLLQHAQNPVDWLPWGEEAFSRARVEDKPVFLSIGYSTCHWCHVMAHESFEDEQVAALMNQTFISIKVDREERPDIDHLYMTVCQMMTGGGGWPLTIIMTPEKKPFYAATYIPKRSYPGRIGMLDLVPKVREIWRDNRDRLVADAAKISGHLAALTSSEPGDRPDQSVVAEAFNQLAAEFDAVNGGFGRAPKFPSPHNLIFLLRYWRQTGEARALTMVETTLRAMALGGIKDHVGFGFHRYSTDRAWLVPHFEKMLYDQAMMSRAYLEAFQATGNSLYRETAVEVLAYVLRDMTSPEGAFFSAEDADSEGEEGKFYVWTEAEIRKVLDEPDANLAVRIFNVKPEGNFKEEATGRLTGRNILHLNESGEHGVAGLNIPTDELAGRMEKIRGGLFDYRKKRVRPGLDDKVLTDWNGLMISALAMAAQVLDEPLYARAARKAADFILSNLRDSDGRLLHRYRDGQAAFQANLDDYAWLIMGLLDLYEALFEVRYLETALELNRDLTAHFRDEKAGGFYFTPDDAPFLLARIKKSYDGAIPSGNSAAMMNLMRLARMTGDQSLEAKAVEIGRAFAGELRQTPSVHTGLLTAVMFDIWGSFEAVISGNPEAQDTQDMINALRRQYTPDKVVLLRPDGEGEPDIVRVAEFTRNQVSLNGRATAYICRNRACNRPVTDIDEMIGLIRAGKS